MHTDTHTSPLLWGWGMFWCRDNDWSESMYWRWVSDMLQWRQIQHLRDYMRAQGNYTILCVCVCFSVCACVHVWKCPTKTSALKLGWMGVYRGKSTSQMQPATHIHTECKSPLALRGQATTRNIKVRGEEGKTSEKRGMERKIHCSLPHAFLSQCVSGLRLWQTSWEAGSSAAW